MTAFLRTDRKDVNPLEQMVLDMADYYVELVEMLTAEIAPVRPWWTEELKPDEQLWRYMDVREEIMAWLMQAGALMGYTTADDVLAHLEELFTSERTVDVWPPAFVAEIPVALLEMVQATGPKEAAKHIRKMERLFAARAEALGILSNTDQPDIPELPPPLPIETLPGTAGWPLYGGAATAYGLGKAEGTPPAFAIPA